jgi:hypothetical protein
MLRTRSFRLASVGRASILGGLAFVLACADDFDTSRPPSTLGTLGEEVYGVFCDRVGAQALHDDPTGASFYGLCHKGTVGAYIDKVDVSQLPALADGALDVNGNPVPLATQQAYRDHAVARIEALAAKRSQLIAALDFTMPDAKVSVKDLKNPDATKSCQSPAGGADQRSLHDELADLLSRFTDLYNDGTIPESTESLARVMNAFRGSQDARAAYARLDARLGYRPIQLALGAARPVAAYPGLRDLSNTALNLLSADSNPFDPNAKRDADGKRIPTPGAAYPQLTKALEVAHAELRDVQPDPAPGALGTPAQDVSGRWVVNRPRTNFELLQNVAYAEDPAFGNGASSFIARRDTRGYAALFASGPVPAPFVDKDGDQLPDVDGLGRFITGDGSAAPTPFFAVGSSPGATRDGNGRVLDASGKLLYQYIDTGKVFASSAITDVKPLLNPDLAAKHETLMYALAGAELLLGQRDGSAVTTKQYSPDPDAVDTWKVLHPDQAPPAGLSAQPVNVKYNAFHTETSPLIDLAYALGQLMGDKTSDDTLAFAREMITNHTADVARLAGDALYVKTQIADQHPEAHIPKASTFWDEMIDVVVQIGKEPGLLEDVLAAFADDAAGQLGPILGDYMTYKDHVSYDRSNINGTANLTTGGALMTTPVDRSQPDTGDNRSAFQKFVQTVVDTSGVAACNKQGALVHAHGTALGDLNLPNDTNLIVRLNYGSKMSFNECEVFKIDDVAHLYIDSMVGDLIDQADSTDKRGKLYFRDNLLRAGFLGIGASTVDVVQKSSGLTGFWDGPTGTKFEPTPQWLNRLVFFDLLNDSPNPTDKNYLTNHFINDLQGQFFTGTTLCQERVIDDPSPSSPDALPDKKVHGLRTCKDGDWFVQRDKDALFVFEDFGFYNAIRPVVWSFVKHKREDLFIQMMAIVNKHFQDANGTASECRLGLDASGNSIPCTKDGVVTYEPIVAGLLGSDLMQSLHDITKMIQGLTINHCTQVDPGTHACTVVQPMKGIDLLAETTRAAVDPDLAAAAKLKTRSGRVTGLRNDGTTNPQITPLYLVIEALNEVEDALSAYKPRGPADDRKAMWKTARSQLVDQFLDVNGKNTPTASFANASIPAIAPFLIDTVRTQLWAHCPNSFTPPYARCDWARDQTTNDLVTKMQGPVFAAAYDVIEAIRSDDSARSGIERLATYLLDRASANDARAAVVGSLADAIQVMSDDTNLVPLFHALASAAAPSVVDDQGHVLRQSVVDAQLAFLARMNGRAMDDKGNEICAREIDPNQILPIVLENLVTPMTGSDGAMTETPLEQIMDIVSSVNRAAPGATSKLDAGDYGSITNELSEFLLDEQRGMEQLYAIVRQGTQGN